MTSSPLIKPKRQDQNPSNRPLSRPCELSGKWNETETATEVETALPSPRARADEPLAALAETAKDYARAARAENTRRAYDADWRIFPPGCAAKVFRNRRPTRRRSGFISPLAPRRPAAGRGRQASPRWSGGCRAFAGIIASLASRSTHETAISRRCSPASAAARRPPVQKEAIFADELLAMLAMLDMDLRGLRDRAILAIGFAGRTKPLRDRRPRLAGPSQSEDGTGWIEILRPPAPC